MCIRCAIFHGSFPYQGDLFLPDDLLTAQFEECVFRRPRSRQAISLWPVIIEVRLQGAVQRRGDEAEAGGCRRRTRINRSPACPRTLPRRPERPVGTGDSDKHKADREDLSGRADKRLTAWPNGAAKGSIGALSVGISGMLSPSPQLSQDGFGAAAARPCLEFGAPPDQSLQADPRR